MFRLEKTQGKGSEGMKISELIKQLQDYLDKNGDEDVSVEYPIGYGSTALSFNITLTNAGIIEVI